MIIIDEHFVLSGLDRIRIRVFILTFRPAFNGLLFVSIALAVADTFVNFDSSKST